MSPFNSLRGKHCMRTKSINFNQLFCHFNYYVHRYVVGSNPTRGNFVYQLHCSASFLNIIYTYIHIHNIYTYICIIFMYIWTCTYVCSKNQQFLSVYRWLLSPDDGSSFEKHYKDIYPTELELQKENDSNSCASFLDLYIYIKNEEFYTRLFDKRNNFGFDIVRMPFYCSTFPSKMFYRSMSIGAEFRIISRAFSKIEDLSRNCKKSSSRTLKKGKSGEFNFPW